MYMNSIKDISALSSLTNLKFLKIGYNRISNIGPLGGLTELTELNFNGNKISGIRSRIALTRMKFRKVWRAMDSNEQGLFVLKPGLLLLMVILLTLRMWSRRVSKRYTKEP